ncbi:MAG: glycosyltransferase [Lachnoclostridium sp.]|jgi:glycosyltransferase involved in cell wall biosynthesis|nr:glycosyltransferase [Lachnoclostridium sp.]
MNSQISIVIPVYNSIKDIRDCLDSVLAQTYKNIEILLIDGESEDGSTDICREYEEKDSRVRFVSKKNEGVSASRNLGIRMAKGEYLQFVDSDDRLIPSACEKMAGHIEKQEAGVVICGYRMCKEQREKRPEPGFFQDITELIPVFSKYFNHDNNMINVPWNKLYRRSFVKCEFPEDLSKGEDLLFNLGFLSQVKGIVFADDVIYDYNNTNEDSLGYRFREDGFEIEERLYKQVCSFVNRFSDKKQGRDLLYIHAYFLDGLKGKCIALILRSGKSRKECIRWIGEWVRKPSVRGLLKYKRKFGKRDRLFLTLIQYRLAGVIYFYYHHIYK